MADKTLYERLGGAYAIATAVDYLINRLHTNATLNSRNQKVNEFHKEQYKAGYKFMVTAWCIEVTVGRIAIRVGTCSSRTSTWA
jgi:hemoglobin